MRSIRRSAALLVLLAAVYGGFVYGRALGAEFRHHGHHSSLVRLLSWNGGFTTDGIAGADSSVPPADVFDTVLDHIQHEFVESGDATSNAHLSRAALTRMLASLEEPHTRFLDPALRSARQDAFSGRHHGIGAILSVTVKKRGDVEYRRLSVVDAMPGSPAERAGLRTGDNITEIDGHWVIAYSPRAELDRIDEEKGDEATKAQEAKQVNARFQKGYSLTRALPILSIGEGKLLHITLERPSVAAPIKISLVTGITDVDPVDFRMLENHIGYLKIRQFNAEATRQVEEELGRVSGLRGLIVDLRGNSGGVRATVGSPADGLAAARRLVGRLTAGGTCALLERRPGRREPLTVVSDRPFSAPLAVLVDHGTANLAELAAIGLRDIGHGSLIGERTFGDDMLTFFGPLSGGSGVEMASARVFSAKGAALDQGVDPQIHLTAAEDSVDGGIRRALSVLGS